MLNIEELKSLSIAPVNNRETWLQSAETGVDYVKTNSNSSDVILYASIGQSCIYSVLAPLEQINATSVELLAGAHLDVYSGWTIEHCSGLGRDEIYLADSFDNPGCESFTGGEQLVFRRVFEGVDKRTRTEISQKLVHALDLYWQDELSAFCRLSEDGDVEPIIRILDLNRNSIESNEVVVTIDAFQLHRFMAVTESALVMKFDFTRFSNDSFGGWGDSCNIKHDGDEIYYFGAAQSACSYVQGALVVRPYITKEELIEKNRRSWSREGKEYAIFKAYDWKNNRNAEISCAPDSLASYFVDSPLPYQTTPAFFKPAVLQKYKADPEKYALGHRSISSRGGWYLKSYDVSESGQVHTYLCYLADLPYSEQLYWLSFNEWPKGPISKRAFETDFEGRFASIADPLIIIKRKVEELDKAKPGWWHPRGDALISRVHYPITTAVEEWGEALLLLDQLLVEGLAGKQLKKLLKANGNGKDFEQYGSIKLLREIAISQGMEEEDSRLLVKPFEDLHYLRNKIKSHSAEGEKQKLVKEAISSHGSLAGHYKDLVDKCEKSFDQMVSLLELSKSSNICQ